MIDSFCLKLLKGFQACQDIVNLWESMDVVLSSKLFILSFAPYSLLPTPGDLFDMLLPMLSIYQEYVRNHHYCLQVSNKMPANQNVYVYTNTYTHFDEYFTLIASATVRYWQPAIHTKQLSQNWNFFPLFSNCQRKFAKCHLMPLILTSSGAAGSPAFPALCKRFGFQAFVEEICGEMSGLEIRSGFPIWLCFFLLRRHPTWNWVLQTIVKSTWVL